MMELMKVVGIEMDLWMVGGRVVEDWMGKSGREKKWWQWGRAEYMGGRRGLLMVAGIGRGAEVARGPSLDRGTRQQSKDNSKQFLIVNDGGKMCCFPTA
jgi:hypothetical protein